MRILIFDGAPNTWQAGLARHGAPTNAELFEAALARHASDAAMPLSTFTLNVADGEQLPQGLAFADFDGMVITGSPLNVYRPLPAVTRQIELARELLLSGMPTWGSCWGLQLATVALGGEVQANPRGRELGIARRIALTPAGRAHAVYAGKPAVFDALCSHQDEVTAVPSEGVVLAGNGVSAVQAMSLEHGRVSFVGVQYHPEHAFATTAAIVEARAHRLVDEGLGRTVADFLPMIADLRMLELEPHRRDAAWRLGIDETVTVAAIRTAEMGDWLNGAVARRARERQAAAI